MLVTRITARTDLPRLSSFLPALVKLARTVAVWLPATVKNGFAASTTGRARRRAAPVAPSAGERNCSAPAQGATVAQCMVLATAVPATFSVMRALKIAKLAGVALSEQEILGGARDGGRRRVGTRAGPRG